jgi:hypothetical protein
MSRLLSSLILDLDEAERPAWKPCEADVKKEIRSFLSIPMHKGKTVKKGLLVAQIKKAGLTVEEFMKFYK